MLPLHLLVVDDSLADLQLVTAAFEEYPDVHLTTHDQAQVALSWLEAQAVAGNKPDLVLLDLHMPGMDGPAWLSAVQQRPALQQVPVLLYSMTPMDRQSQQVDASQVCGCWQKPMTFPEMQFHADHLYGIWERERVFTPTSLREPPPSIPMV